MKNFEYKSHLLKVRDPRENADKVAAFHQSVLGR